MFVDADFDIISVSNGDAAIRKFDELHPAVVLADIYMPGKTGYEVCAYVKRSERGDTPVVLLAGAFDAYDEKTAAAAGATTHITKPFEPQALVNLVVSLLAPGASPAARPPAAAAPAPPAPEVRPADATPAVKESAAAPAPVAPARREDSAEDLLGLDEIFKPAPVTRPPAAITEEEIDRIADRVIQKLSTQVIEDVAWHVVPDITTKVLREELKRQS
jgi:CheY-like chemotaxis protein